MTYLIVGLDQNTLAPLDKNIRADDVTTAKRIALAHAEAPRECSRLSVFQGGRAPDEGSR